MQVCLFVCLFWSKQLLPCMNKKTKVKEREYRIYENASEITEVCLADHSYTFFRYPEQTRSLRSHQEFSPKLGNKRSFLPDNTLFESPPPPHCHSSLSTLFIPRSAFNWFFFPVM